MKLDEIVQGETIATIVWLARYVLQLLGQCQPQNWGLLPVWTAPDYLTQGYSQVAR